MGRKVIIVISNIDINAVLRHSFSSIKFYLWIGIFKRANKILYLKKEKSTNKVFSREK